MNINYTFQFKKVRKMQNLGNVYIWRSPFVMSRTDAQNGVDIIFKNLYRLQGQIIGNRLFCLNAVFRASFSRVIFKNRKPTRSRRKCSQLELIVATKQSTETVYIFFPRWKTCHKNYTNNKIKL